MTSKKSRGQNFTPDEKEILVELVKKYEHSIENKKTDAAANAMKTEAWAKLAEEFNSRSSQCTRTVVQLKTCWDNIKRNKRKSRREEANENIGMTRTGSGSITDGLKNEDSDSNSRITSICPTASEASENNDLPNKKSRGQNFTNDEKELLIYLVKKRKHLLESNMVDKATNTMKLEAWKKLTEEFNSRSEDCTRTKSQLKTCWHNIKRHKREIKDEGAKNQELTRSDENCQEEISEPTIDDVYDYDSDSNSHITSISSASSVASEYNLLHSKSKSKTMPRQSGNTAGDIDMIEENYGLKRSSADLKTPVTIFLKSPSREKRGKSSINRRQSQGQEPSQYQVLQKILEVTEALLKKSESEGNTKHLILEEQLKQEKIRTEMLQIELNKLKAGLK